MAAISPSFSKNASLLVAPPQAKEIALVVPVKEWPQAKKRLSTVLNTQERTILAELMLTHVLEQVQILEPPLRRCVITSYLPAMKLARSMGVEVIGEIHQRSENDSLRRANIDLAKRGIKGVLRLPADLPLLQIKDLQVLLNPILGGAQVVLSPSADRTGTNALYRSPPNLFDSKFGEDSLRAHLQLAKGCGVKVVRVERPGISMDIDEPADIARWLKEAPAPSACMAFLQKINIPQRLSQQGI